MQVIAHNFAQFSQPEVDRNRLSSIECVSKVTTDTPCTDIYRKKTSEIP